MNQPSTTQPNENNSISYELITINNDKWRVKLYHLNQKGEWIDKNTGYVFISKKEQPTPSTPDFIMTMISELDQSVLFELNVLSKQEFHLQKISIITWKESPDTNQDDRAISFQDVDGVKEVWSLICMIKNVNNNEANFNLYQDIINDSEENEYYEYINGNNYCYYNHENVNVEKLPFIANDTVTGLSPVEIENINKIVLEENCAFVRKLQEIFDEEERKLTLNENDINSSKNLNYIFLIFKHLFQIANKDLYETLMNDEFYLFAFGALEYDKSISKPYQHRNYLNSNSNFKNILNLNNADLLNMIKLNFRLMYLKEFALGNFIDETNQTLSSIIKDNLIYIIKYFINNKDLFQSLPDKLKDKTQSLDCILFINELISYVNESFYGKREIFSILCDYGIISAISQILREENESKNNESLLKSNIIKIIYNFIKSTPDLFNDYLFMKTFQNDNMNINNNITLIEHLCDVLITSDDFGIKYEIGNIIKNIIENTTNDTHNNNNNTTNTNSLSNDIINGNSFSLSNILFDKCLPKLISQLTIAQPQSKSFTNTKQITIEIICHTINLYIDITTILQIISYYDITTIMSKILYNQHNKVIHLYQIKYFQTVISHFEFDIVNTALNEDVFDFLFQIYNDNCKKDNMLFACIRNLFSGFTQFVHKTEIINYVMSKYNEKIYAMKSCGIFNDIITFYKEGDNYYYCEFEGNNNNINNEEVVMGECGLDEFQLEELFENNNNDNENKGNIINDKDKEIDLEENEEHNGFLNKKRKLECYNDSNNEPN